MTAIDYSNLADYFAVSKFCLDFSHGIPTYAIENILLLNDINIRSILVNDHLIRKVCRP